jgi:prepilin peptidase CpaA
MIPTYILAACVAGFTLAAAVIDFRTKKIPNWLTVPSAIAALIFHLVSGGGTGLLLALAGFAVGFALLILPWILGGGGMGDVKLLAALGTWLGPLMILPAFGLGAICALMMGIMLMTSSMFTSGMSATQRRFLNKGGAATATAGTAPRKYKRVLPFAVPVAAGTWLVLAWMLIKATAQH